MNAMFPIVNYAKTMTEFELRHKNLNKKVFNMRTRTIYIWDSKTKSCTKMVIEDTTKTRIDDHPKIKSLKESFDEFIENAKKFINPN